MPGIHISHAEIRHEIGVLFVIVHREVFEQTFLAGEVRERVMVLNRHERLPVESAAVFKLCKIVREILVQYRAEMMLKLGIGQLFVHADEHVIVGAIYDVTYFAVGIVADLAGSESFVARVDLIKPFVAEAFRRKGTVDERYPLLLGIARDRRSLVRRKLGVSVVDGVVIGAYLLIGHVGIAERRIYLGYVYARGIGAEMLRTVAVTVRFVVIHVVVAHRDEYLKIRFTRRTHLVLKLTKKICDLDVSLYLSVERHIAGDHEVIGHLFGYLLKRSHVIRRTFQHHFHARSHVRVIIRRTVSWIGVTVIQRIIMHIRDMRDDRFVGNGKFFLGKRAVRTVGKRRESGKSDDRNKRNRHQGHEQIILPGRVHILSSRGQDPLKISSKYYIIYIKSSQYPSRFLLPIF